jgi:hypothetical protein
MSVYDGFAARSKEDTLSYPKREAPNMKYL